MSETLLLLPSNLLQLVLEPWAVVAAKVALRTGKPQTQPHSLHKVSFLFRVSVALIGMLFKYFVMISGLRVFFFFLNFSLYEL